MKLTIKDAELFIGALVKVGDCYAEIIRVYDNGILTSAGFYNEVEFDEAHAMIDTVDADVIYYAFAGLHLPPDWPDRTFKFGYVQEGSFSGEQSIDEIDLITCSELEEMDCPYIDNAPPVFKAADGVQYNMVKLCVHSGQ